MRLRYDKNFHTGQVRSFPKYYGNELQARIEKAIRPKHHPVLVKPSQLGEVTDKSKLATDSETTLRIKALYLIDNTWQNKMQEDIRILPQETISAWFERITLPGKYSTLQVDSFQRIVKNIQDHYTHARHLPEPFTAKHVEDIMDSITKLMEKINLETKKRAKKKNKKKMTRPEQAMRFVQHVTETASQFNPLSRRSEEHQKLL